MNLPDQLKTIMGWRGDSLACPQAFGGDIYAGCSMGCWFCFCRELENKMNAKYDNWVPGMVRPSDPNDWRRAFDMALGSDRVTNDWNVKCLRARIPFNMGSKAETFCAEDRKFDVVAPVLEVFREYKYPIIFETKSHFIGMKRYMDVIKELNCAVIVAVMGGPAALVKRLEPDVVDVSMRWTLVQQLNQLDIWSAVRWEPVLMGINSQKAHLESFADNCRKFNVKHASVFNYRTSDLEQAVVAFESNGFDYEKLIVANERDWAPTGQMLMKLLKDRSVPVSSPDFVNLGFESDCESCCGVDHKFGLKYRFNFMYALTLIKQKGSVCIDDLLSLELKNPDAEKLLIEAWNGSKRIYTLKDHPGLTILGFDSRGFAVYGRKIVGSINNRLSLF